MGRKVHPYGYRLGIIKPWRARWYAEGDEYGQLLAEDMEVRRTVHDQVGHAGISEIMIERFPRQVNVTIHTAKPGIVIGRKGVTVNALRDRLRDLTGKTARIDVVEVPQPETDAAIISESVANQLQRRISHKRAMKQAGWRAMRAGAEGIKIVVGGRLSGAEMARRDQFIMGRVPRQTLRADIDYAQNEALTTYGRIGVKCWVYRGEILPGDEKLGATDSDFESWRTRVQTMLMPKRTKFRKQFRGRMRGKASRGNQVEFGEFGLQSLSCAWITSRQIEAARRAIVRHVKRGGKVVIRIFPDKPVTQKAAETRMGSGKGAVDHWVAVVRPGHMLFEISGVTSDQAREAFRLASHKLPVKTQLVAREQFTLGGGDAV